MSAQPSARQNRIRLIAIFLLSAFLVAAFQLYQHNVSGASQAARGPDQAKQLDETLFLGLRHASPSEVRAALPETFGKPTLINFSSRLCHDCKRLAPVVSALVAQHPQIHFVKLDIMEDQQKYPAIFRAFKPVSVPVLVFINSRSEIQNVLYNYQKPNVVAAALMRLEKENPGPVVLNSPDHHSHRSSSHPSSSKPR